jgi:hypothetical protein
MSDIRPAVISQASLSLLDEFKDFRHVVRNVYAVNLVPEKLDNLMAKLPLLWPQLQNELLGFADLLEAIVQSRQE